MKLPALLWRRILSSRGWYDGGGGRIGPSSVGDRRNGGAGVSSGDLVLHDAATTPIVLVNVAMNRFTIRFSVTGVGHDTPISYH
jgi:hypothetical protein